MPWFNVDDGFAFHRKAVKAGNSAIGLWTRAGSLCAQQLTDGFVPAEMVKVLGTPAQARKLVAAGLWVEVEGGFQFHEWSADNRNPTRESVLLKRQKEAEKKSRQRSGRSGNHEDVQANGDSPQGTEPGQDAGHPKGVDVSPPLPSPPKGQKGTTSPSKPRKRGTRIPDDFTVTPDMVTWARDRVPNVDGRVETEKFRNYWQAASGRNATKLDWVATWRNWMLNAAERAPARASPNGFQSQTDANIHALLTRPALRALPGGDS